MMLDNLRISTDARRFYLVLGWLILVAWGFLFAWQRSAYTELLSHEVIEDHGLPPVLRLATFILSWFLMTVAMMLPGSLPLLNDSIQPLRQRMVGNWQAGLTILGYLIPWTLFGLSIYAGDSVLHRMTEPDGLLAAFSGSIAPAIVLMAGLYQFTPVKRSSLARCRTSHALSQQCSWENPGIGKALHQGIRLGVFCLGSCWAMMLLMFAVGHNRLDWMLALGGIMAAERLTPWGHRLAWLVGLGLIFWATFWVLGPMHSHP